MTNSPIPADEIEAQAVAWAVRVGDPAFADWDGFGQWLATSPTHADAYHAAAAAAAEMVDLLATATPRAVVAAPVRPRWRPAPWLGGALAAALLLVVGYGAFRPAEPILYQTAPGQHRDVALADGTRIALNGGTRLTVAANDPRAIRLERGEALFTVRHDPTHPFSVTVGDATIADVGTVFDVVREQTTTQVAVVEGIVLWDPAGGAVRLDAGRRLRATDGGATLELASADRQAIGGWTRGQLSYDGAPLGEVAADLSRALGVVVTVSPGAAARPVRGVVRLDGGAGAVMPRLAALLGIGVRHDGGGWRLSSTP